MATLFAFVSLSLFPDSPYWLDPLDWAYDLHHRSAPGECAKCNRPLPSMPASSVRTVSPIPGTPPCGFVQTGSGLPINQAQIQVVIPSEAKLYVNGAEITGQGESRTLTTPAITPGVDYDYELRAEFIENGVQRFVERTVTIRGGYLVPVDLVAAARTRQTVRR